MSALLIGDSTASRVVQQNFIPMQRTISATCMTAYNLFLLVKAYAFSLVVMVLDSEINLGLVQSLCST